MGRARTLQGALFASICAASFLGGTGCAEDRILPVPFVCGDGVKDPNEQCDVADIGCVRCRIAPGYTCTEEAGDDGGTVTKCVARCGDGEVAPGKEECDPPDGITCDSSCQGAAKTAACDLTGYWLVREMAFSVDSVIQAIQTVSTWYIVKMSQTGEVVQIDKAISCGIIVTGSATVQPTDEGVRNMIWSNPQDLDAQSLPVNPRPPRRGTFRDLGDRCELTLDRHYTIRGADEGRFTPADFVSSPDLATLPPLPYEIDPINPTLANVDGALDTDGDGLLGFAYVLSGAIEGRRNAAQRDWVEYFTPSDWVIPRFAIEFSVRERYANQESILSVTNCTPTLCPFLVANATPHGALNHRAHYLYLGNSITEPRVSRILTRELKEDREADFQSCLNERIALPHDPAKQ